MKLMKMFSLLSCLLVWGSSALSVGEIANWQEARLTNMVRNNNIAHLKHIIEINPKLIDGIPMARYVAMEVHARAETDWEMVSMFYNGYSGAKHSNLWVMLGSILGGVYSLKFYGGGNEGCVGIKLGHSGSTVWAVRDECLFAAMKHDKVYFKQDVLMLCREGVSKVWLGEKWINRFKNSLIEFNERGIIFRPNGAEGVLCDLMITDSAWIANFKKYLTEVERQEEFKQEKGGLLKVRALQIARRLLNEMVIRGQTAWREQWKVELSYDKVTEEFSLSDEEITAAIEQVMRGENLKVMNLSGCKSQASIEVLIELLKKRNDIKVLILANCNLSQTNAQNLLQVLAHPRLHTIDVTGNNLPDELEQALHARVSNNSLIHHDLEQELKEYCENNKGAVINVSAVILDVLTCHSNVDIQVVRDIIRGLVQSGVVSTDEQGNEDLLANTTMIDGVWMPSELTGDMLDVRNAVYFDSHR